MKTEDAAEQEEKLCRGIVAKPGLLCYHSNLTAVMKESFHA
jgi:hypothetical protein